MLRLLVFVVPARVNTSTLELPRLLEFEDLASLSSPGLLADFPDRLLCGAF